MPGNKRVYFACLGVARCKENTILNDVISADLSVAVNINNIFSPGSTTPTTTYAEMPNVDFSYTSYLTSFQPITSEYGLNNFVGFNLAVGLDSTNTSSYAGLFSGASTIMADATGSPPYAAVGCSLANLSSIVYSLPVDGFFTVKRSYKGFAKTSPTPPSSFTESTRNTLRRQCFQGTLPNGIADNAIQNIDITYSINRTMVQEFATRKPYASYVNFPIETTVQFELLTQKLDTYTINSMQTACRNIGSLKENIVISVEQAGSLNIRDAYLTNIAYNGGSANSNDNQTMSVTYTSYAPIEGLKPVTIQTDEDPCA